jgi:hypothetical protein
LYVPLILVIFLLEGLGYAALSGNNVTNAFPAWTPPQPPIGTTQTTTNCGSVRFPLKCQIYGTANPLDSLWYAFSYVASILGFVVASLIAVLGLIGAAMFSFLPIAIMNAVLLVILAIALIKVFLP